MAFVHLHVHSQFSLLDGTLDPEEIAGLAAEHQMPAVALTDTCNLFGAVAFFKACQSKGVKPILGAELHVQPEGLAHEDAHREESGYQLLALVEDHRGYHNLCQLVTRAIFDGMAYKPRVDLDLLRAHHEGLIFLTGGHKGVCARALAAGDEAGAQANIEALAAFLGPDQLFLELQDVGLPGQEAINEGLRGFSKKMGLGTVVTNGVHYRSPEDAPVHELLNAVALGCSMSDASRIVAPTDQACFKTEAQMRAVFPNDGDALDRTVEIAERCHYAFDFDTYHFPATTPPDPDPDGGRADSEANWRYFFEAFPPPLDFDDRKPGQAFPPKPDGAGSLEGYFEWYARRGLQERLNDIPDDRHPDYWERLQTEIDIIEGMGFPAYLLIVAEFINWSKDQGIPVGPGRGSAAGSLVAWAMRITEVDPLQFDLLFERFLNPERVSMPDIDVDFCQDRREEAITHVRQKYGDPLVAQIITYGKLKAKAAVRDVARVLDLSYTEADGLAKLVPDQLNITLEEALDEVEQLRALRDGDPRVRRVLQLARRVEGYCRQTGVHAAGVVIADRPLVEYAPLYRDEPEGDPVLQYDMKQAEDIGLIKFDFLGLKTLDQIRDAVVAVERNKGIHIDIDRIPHDDPATYALLQEGDSLGVFQVESSGMRELLTRLKPNCLDDLVALLALYRPGPLNAGMVDDFVERKHGRREISYPLPMLEPILSSTYGTIVYQEQVMLIAQEMAGYTLGEADLLRRAMGKKKAAEMEKQKSRFLSGSISNGIPEEKALEIFDQLAKFAAYCFNRSHAAAYGLISYQTAWLKANHRAEYMAALMSIEAANTDKVLAYIEDSRAAGIAVEPVCVNHSARDFRVSESADGQSAIRFGLAAVKNVGEGAIQAVLEARAEAPGQAFTDVPHFLEGIDHRRVNRRALEYLIKAGALDFGGIHRAALLAGLEKALSEAARLQADRLAGQGSLFGGVVETAPAPTFRFPDTPPWTLSEQLAHEKDALGLFLSGHPMQSHAEDVARLASCSISGLRHHAAENEVRVIGLPVDTRAVRTRRGDRMAFVRLEDEGGSAECVFFPEAWTRSQRALKKAEAVLVVGRVEMKGDEVKILAQSAEPLSDVRARTVREVSFRLQVDELAGDRLTRFVSALDGLRGGCRSRLLLTVPGKMEAELDLPAFPVEPSTELEDTMRALFGRPDVVVLR